MLLSRGVPPNRYSLNLQKIVKNPQHSKIIDKYHAQFFSMLLFSHKENEINKISSHVSFKSFVKIF